MLSLLSKQRNKNALNVFWRAWGTPANKTKSYRQALKMFLLVYPAKSKQLINLLVLWFCFSFLLSVLISRMCLHNFNKLALHKESPSSWKWEQRVSVPRTAQGLPGDWDMLADCGCPILTSATASFDSLTLMVCKQHKRPENSLFPCPGLCLSLGRNLF